MPNPNNKDNDKKISDSETLKKSMRQVDTAILVYMVPTEIRKSMD